MGIRAADEYPRQEWLSATDVRLWDKDRVVFARALRRLGKLDVRQDHGVQWVRRGALEKAVEEVMAEEVAEGLDVSQGGMHSVAEAQGETLDSIGEILGVRRGTRENDENYRRRIGQNYGGRS